MTRENKSKFVILGFLSHEPMSGYDLKKRIEASVSNFYDISYGQIYPELARLESQGLVTKEVIINDGKPNRKIYSITNKGLEDLKEWVAAEVAEEKVQYDILLKLFFGNQISKDDNIRNIELFREKNQKKLALMKGYEENLRQVLKESPDHIYFLLTVLFGKQVHTAYIQWADEAVRILNQQE